MKPFSRKAREFLFELERYPSKDRRVILAELGMKIGTYYQWRRRKDFVERMDSILLNNAARSCVGSALGPAATIPLVSQMAGPPACGPDPVANLSKPELSGPLQAFLSAFRRTDDRMEAAQEAGVSWDEIQKSVSANDGFAEAYFAIMEERRIRCLDLILHQALKEGDAGAAKAYLATEQKTKTKEVTRENPEAESEGGNEVLSGWLEKFQGKRNYSLSEV